MIRKFIILCMGFVGLIVLVNLGIAIYAFWEKNSDWGIADRWILSSHVLNAELQSPIKSIILVHGFTGSPYDFRFLAENLRDSGYRVVIPVVPGQTKTTLAYQRGKYTAEYYINWLSKIVESETRKFGRKPILIGFSMGGTISTIVASSGRVEKLVLIAPFFGLPKTNALVWKSSRIVSWIVPVIPKFAGGKINDPSGYAQYRPGTYIVSLEGFNQLEELAVMGKGLIAGIEIPTLILASPNDQVASYARTSDLFKSKMNVQILTYPESNHVLLNDYDRNAAIKAIKKFISS